MDNQIPINLDKRLLDADGSGNLLPHTITAVKTNTPVIVNTATEIEQLKARITELQAEAIEREEHRQYLIHCITATLNERIGENGIKNIHDQLNNMYCRLNGAKHIDSLEGTGFGARLLKVAKAAVCRAYAKTSDEANAKYAALDRAITDLTSSDKKTLGVE